ncbi:phosphoadenylyl-sulfate reductase [Pontibacter sp. G13]|uniref:phosphoadenylyl-sulfate reductase n=1 Tax=Pontibacter sp. G13 TaxID=3074898 RepID=UPI00288C1D4D|nr:phosphoadenylyl-sulfate reductase [Pontibacter sp. G13]WNJ18823.1 phosphoadenylyl-sulfate reductase [Pontibacter sp. G13]
MDIKTLCEKYSPYDHRKRLEAIFRDFDRVLVTSSFGTTSAILLNLLRKVKPDHPIHFVDTRYHFPETLEYKEELTRKWNLNVVSVQPPKNEHTFTQLNYTWAHQPDLCCHLNKVDPLEKVKETHDVWISGMMGGTNDNRKTLELFKEDKGMLRFYPFIDMSLQEAEWSRVLYELPQHPLELKGYGSVGCKHCTHKGAGRAGRWVGFDKTECGLHAFKH